MWLDSDPTVLYDARYPIPSALNQKTIGPSTTYNPGTGSGTFNIQFPGFTPGDKIDFLASVESQARTSAVPIPGALWLLGSGLVGLVSIRRRIQK